MHNLTGVPFDARKKLFKQFLKEKIKIYKFTSWNQDRVDS